MNGHYSRRLPPHSNLFLIVFWRYNNWFKAWTWTCSLRATTIEVMRDCRKVYVNEIWRNWLWSLICYAFLLKMFFESWMKRKINCGSHQWRLDPRFLLNDSPDVAIIQNDPKARYHYAIDLIKLSYEDGAWNLIIVVRCSSRKLENCSPFSPWWFAMVSDFLSLVNEIWKTLNVLNNN